MSSDGEGFPRRQPCQLSTACVLENRHDWPCIVEFGSIGYCAVPIPEDLPHGRHRASNKSAWWRRQTKPLP